MNKDDLLFAEEFKYGPGLLDTDLEKSARASRFLRHLRRLSPIAEGQLAAYCGEKLYLPQWTPLLKWFETNGYIDLTPTGRGRAVTVTITEKGEQMAADKLGPKPAEPVASSTSVGLTE